MSLKLSKPLVILFIQGLLLTSLSGVAAFYGINRTISSQSEVNKTYTILSKLKEAILLTTQAESYVRGYVITGSETYLEGFDEAQRELPVTLTLLEGFVNEDSSQIDSLKTLKDLIYTRMDRLVVARDLRKEKGFQATYDYIKTQKGRKLAEEIKALSTSIELRELEDLNSKYQQFLIYISITYATIIGFLIVGFILIVVSPKALKEVRS